MTRYEIDHVSPTPYSEEILDGTTTTAGEIEVVVEDITNLPVDAGGDAPADRQSLLPADKPPRSAIVAALSKEQLKAAVERYFGAYEKGLTAKERLSVLLQTANNAATSPQRCAMIFEALRQAAAEQPEDYAFISIFRDAVSYELERQASRSGQTPTVRQVGGFLELAAQDKELGPHARKVLRGFVKGADTQAAIVALMHNMCCHALETDDPAVQKLVAEIGSLSTTVWTTDDRQAGLYMAAALAPDDHTFVQFFDCDHVFDVLRHAHRPDLEEHYDNACDNLGKHPNVLKLLEKTREANPARASALGDFLKFLGGFDGYKGKLPESTLDEMMEPLRYPDSIVQQERHLRTLYLGFLDRYLVQTGVLPFPSVLVSLPDGTVRPINLPKATSAQDIREAASAVTTAFYNETGNHKDKGVVEKPDQVATALRYIRLQGIDEPQTQSLGELIAALRHDLEEKFIYTVRSRGDRVLVEDEGLQGYGVKELLFEPGRNRREPRVTMTIGNYRLRLVFDDNQNLLAGDRSALDIDLTTQRFWQAIIISHLRELLCREPITPKEAKGATIEGEVVVIRAKTSTVRVSHPRLLKGRHYTAEQAKKVAEDKDLLVDLAEYNRTHKHPENTEYTYIPEKKDVKIGLRHPRPIVSRIHGATDRINAILDAQTQS